MRVILFLLGIFAVVIAFITTNGMGSYFFLLIGANLIAGAAIVDAIVVQAGRIRKELKKSRLRPIRPELHGYQPQPDGREIPERRPPGDD